MRLNSYLLLLAATFFFSCGSKSSEHSNEDRAEEQKGVPANPQPEKKQTPSECYIYLSKKDTTYLQLNEIYNKTTGMLTYRYREKDQNMGTIEGSKIKDLLVADYTFTSEGVSSTRQVVFKKKGDNYVEGFGDVQEVNGKMIYKDINSLVFDETRTLIKAPCNGYFSQEYVKIKVRKNAK